MGILIVDDSEDQLLLLKSILNSNGYTNILLAESADRAFELLGLKGREGDIEVDLILMDIMMPGVDGIEACLRIKEQEELKEIPVIIITANKAGTHLESAFDAGAVDYIKKPIDKTELLARVRSALRLKKETDRRKAREQELMEMTEKLDEANKKLKRLSYLDGLTTVPNRRYFEKFFKSEWKNAIRVNGYISLIMVDIDFFKAYNDTYGHLSGDDCLKKIAKALERALKRPRDFLCRYGGEEFIAVLPETDKRGALEVAERLLREVAALKIVHETSSVSKNVTVSIGVATCKPSRKAKSDLLLNRVDKALYKAKQGGRNRAEVVNQGD